MKKNSSNKPTNLEIFFCRYVSIIFACLLATLIDQIKYQTLPLLLLIDLFRLVQIVQHHQTKQPWYRVFHRRYHVACVII